MSIFDELNHTPGNIAFAQLFLRWVLAVLFFFQAYDKLFVLKPKQVAQTLSVHYTKKGIPSSFIYFSVIVSSIVELSGSILLALGLFSCYLYPVLGLHLVLVAVAFGIANPMWDNKYFTMRFLCLIALMVLSVYPDAYSLDALLTK
jgi:uncharacterized membrane protein YphA (DoxX/SURF4 family)